MSRCVRAARALLLGLFVVGVVSGCSLPLLESQGEGGPTAGDIVNHINCELALIVNRNSIERVYERVKADPELAQELYLLGYLTKSVDARLDERTSADHALNDESGLLDNLIQYHFVASVLVTLDALNSQGINPSLSWITPINNSSTFNRTFSVGGSLNGSQERNINLNYSVDLYNLSIDPNLSKRPPGPPTDIKIIRTNIRQIVDYCTKSSYAISDNGPEGPSGGPGLRGDLGLTDIVFDGLLALNAANNVNTYGSSGPIIPTVTNTIYGDLVLTPGGQGNPNDLPHQITLNINKKDGIISYVGPTGDAATPGTVTFAATAVEKNPPTNDLYFISLTGSNFVSGLSLTGTMTYLGHKPEDPKRKTADPNKQHADAKKQRSDRTMQGLDVTNLFPLDLGKTLDAAKLGLSSKMTLAGQLTSDKKGINVGILSGYVTADTVNGAVTGNNNADNKGVNNNNDHCCCCNNKGNNKGDNHKEENHDNNNESCCCCNNNGTNNNGNNSNKQPVYYTAVFGGQKNEEGIPIAKARQDFIEMAQMTNSPTQPSQGPSKGGAANASAGTTQFGSFVNFIVSYGLNGGPNWTLATFKGPSGGGGGGGGGGGSSGSGGGGGGQLLNISRQDTDSLTITFVAACQDKGAKAATPFTTYWDSIPRCDQLGTLQQSAAAIGTQSNFLRTPVP